MIELVRTNDLVLISFVESVLTQAGVRFFVADNHMSAVEGSLGFLPRRILVDSDQHAAGAPVDARGRPVARTQRWLSAEATSLDAILGGRLRLRQTRDGHRVGLDAILLAAAAGAPVARLADVGAGVGAVGLALLQRWPAATGALIEIDPELAALAQGERRAQRPCRSRPRRRRRRARSAEPPRRRPRRRSGRPRRRQPALSRRRGGARLARRAPRPRPCRRRRAGGARRLGRRLPGAARAGRALRHDPARRRIGGAAAGLRRPARRPRPAPGPPARRRAGDPAADLGNQGLEGALCAFCPA